MTDTIHARTLAEHLLKIRGYLHDVTQLIAAGPLADDKSGEDWLNSVAGPIFRAASELYGSMYTALADTEDGPFWPINELASNGQEAVVQHPRDSQNLADAINDIEQTLRHTFGYTDEDFVVADDTEDDDTEEPDDDPIPGQSTPGALPYPVSLPLDVLWGNGDDRYTLGTLKPIGDTLHLFVFTRWDGDQSLEVRCLGADGTWASLHHVSTEYADSPVDEILPEDFDNLLAQWPVIPPLTNATDDKEA